MASTLRLARKHTISPLPGMASSLNVIQKDPISEDPSDFDSQIRGLQEEKGIFPQEEVVIPPYLEDTDDDSIDHTPEGVGMDRRPSTSKSVRFSARSDDSVEMSTNDQALAKRLEYPHVPVPQADMDLDASVGSTQLHQGYPPSSPPAYTPSEDRRGVNSPKPRMLSAGSAREIAEGFGNTVGPESDNDSDPDIGLAESSFRQNEMFAKGAEVLTEEEKAVIRIVDDYQPEFIQIETNYRPFLLEYIPAIGDIDAFIKVPRPDEVDDNIGLTELDEPAVLQSDPTIIGLQIRNATKETGSNDAPVKKLDRADKNKDEIDNWIKNVRDLHRTRPSPSIVYKSPMPDIEKLMQEWPEEFQDQLRNLRFPTADLDCSLEDYSDICLNLLDIPRGKSRIQALHLMFSLYMEFKKSQHFGGIAQNNQQNDYEAADRLEL